MPIDGVSDTLMLRCTVHKHRLEEAGDRLFTFARLPDSQWAIARRTERPQSANRSLVPDLRVW
jgi:hypothetical protein